LVENGIESDGLEWNKNVIPFFGNFIMEQNKYFIPLFGS